MNFSVRMTSDIDMNADLALSCSEAEHIIAVQVEKDTKPFVPWRTGALTNNTKVIGNEIVYPGPYAHFLYVGKVWIYPPTGSTYAPKDEGKVITDRNLVFTQDFHGQAQSHWVEASKAQNAEKWRRVAEKAVNRNA